MTSEAELGASERTPLVSPHPDGRRWGVLALVCVLSAEQTSSWILWSSIAPVAGPLYGWNKNTFEQLVAVPNLVFLVMCFFWAFLTTRFGIRATVLAVSLFLIVSSSVRLGAELTDQTASMVLQNAAGFFNGLAAPPLNFLPPILAQEWFPPGQRGTACACAAAALILGGAVQNFLGPRVVPEHMQDPRHAVLRLLTVHVVWSCAGFLGALACPDRPAAPPSVSTAQREHAQRPADLFLAMAHWESVVVALLCGLPQGAFAMLASLLGVVLPDCGFSEAATGEVGGVLALAGVLPAVCVGVMSDLLARTLKPIVALLYGAALLGSAGMAWAAMQGPSYIVPLHICAALSGATITASLPIFFEMAVEITYPLTEEATSALIAWTVAAIQALLYTMPLEQLGAAWMLYLLPGTLAVALVALAPFPVVYRRSAVDAGKE